MMFGWQSSNGNTNLWSKQSNKKCVDPFPIPPTLAISSAENCESKTNYSEFPKQPHRLPSKQRPDEYCRRWCGGGIGLRPENAVEG